MKDPWKTSLVEWIGLALIPTGIFILVVVMRYFIPKGNDITAWQIVRCMLPGMVTMVAGMGMIAWGGGKRVEERHKLSAKREAETAAFLTRMKTIYPPDADVFHHLHQLGYQNIYRYVFEVERALVHVTRNYKDTLAGKPVRDADECIAKSEKLVGK